MHFALFLYTTAGGENATRKQAMSCSAVSYILIFYIIQTCTGVVYFKPYYLSIFVYSSSPIMLRENTMNVYLIGKFIVFDSYVCVQLAIMLLYFSCLRRLKH